MLNLSSLYLFSTFLLLFPILILSQDAITFTQRTAAAPFSSRHDAVIIKLTKSLSFKRTTGVDTTLNTPYIFYSGRRQPADPLENDVWASSDLTNWDLASGISLACTQPIGCPSAIPANGLNLLFQPAEISTSTELWLLGGSTDQNNPNTCVNDVYYSSDLGLHWSKINNPNNGFTGRNEGVGVITSSHELLIFTGDDNSNVFFNDVWSSKNGGIDWSLVTSTAPWAPRRRASTGVAYNTALGKDVVYLMAGGSNGVRFNDIWASSDSGANWLLITMNAAWRAREAANLEIGSDGTLVMTAGDAAPAVNDVWISLDGGYRWGLCNVATPFSARWWPATTLSFAGRLVVSGGAISTPTGYVFGNDVWQSDVSFNDGTALSPICQNLEIPPCGMGMQCWNGFWCKNSCSSSSSSSAYAALFWIVFLAFAATLGVCLFTYYKLRRANVASPIPLPATMHRWWNKGGSNNMIIQGDELGAADTGKRDGLYTPLRV